MIDPTRVQFPRVNRSLLQGLFWFLVFLFLASQIRVVRGIYNRLLSKPEVRKEEYAPSTDIYVGNELWLQRVVTIKNRGNADANDVRINVAVLNGRITKFRVLSDELYSVVDPQVTQTEGRLTLALKRLAPGARTVIYVWAVQSAVDGASKVAVSAVFDGGAAESSQKPTALEEIQGLGALLARGLDHAWVRLRSRLELGDLQTAILDLLPSIGIYNLEAIPIEDREFQETLATLGVAIFGTWLLLRRTRAIVLIAVMVGVFSWLFLGFAMDAKWLLLGTFFAFVAFFTTQSRHERIVLVVSTLAVWALIMDFDCVATLGADHLFTVWACVPVAVSGGIAAAYLTVTAYLVIAEF
jgi:hypothetical protein